jgi:hypothetical protein
VGHRREVQFSQTVPARPRRAARGPTDAAPTPPSPNRAAPSSGPRPPSPRAVSPPRNYGGALPALARRHAGLAHGASASPAGGLAAGATGGSNVGAYPITQGALAATGSYTAGTFHRGALTVNPASPKMTADNQATAYSGGVPAPTSKHAGLAHAAIAAFNGGTPAANQATPS